MPLKVCLGSEPQAPGCADFVGIEIAVQREALAAETAGDVEQHVFVAIVVIGHQAIGIVARGGDQQAEAGDGARAGDGEAAFAVAAAFGQQIELRRGTPDGASRNRRRRSWRRSRRRRIARRG